MLNLFTSFSRTQKNWLIFQKKSLFVQGKRKEFFISKEPKCLRFFREFSCQIDVSLSLFYNLEFSKKMRRNRNNSILNTNKKRKDLTSNLITSIGFRSFLFAWNSSGFVCLFFDKTWRHLLEKNSFKFLWMTNFEMAP